MFVENKKRDQFLNSSRMFVKCIHGHSTASRSEDVDMKFTAEQINYQRNTVRELFITEYTNKHITI